MRSISGSLALLAAMRRLCRDFDQARSNLAPNSLANLKAPSGADRGSLIVKAASQFGCSCGRAGEVIATSSISCHSGCCLSSRMIRAFNSAALFFSFFSVIMSGYIGRTTEAGSDAVNVNVRSCSASRAIGSHVRRQKGPASPPGPNFYAQQKRKDLLLLLGRLLSGLRRIGLVLLRVSRGIGLLVAGSGAWRIGHSNFLP